MTLLEHLKKAKEELELSIDTFPDKDDEIRQENDIIYIAIDLVDLILKK